MIYYTNIEARRILAKVAVMVSRKLNVLDLFCKITPNVGEPYFVASKYPEEVGAAADELGIVGQRPAVSEVAPTEPRKGRFGRFIMNKRMGAGPNRPEAATPFLKAPAEGNHPEGRSATEAAAPEPVAGICGIPGKLTPACQ
jgi:hypothetical protein